MSQDTSDVHNMCYSRVSMLTTEVEKLSDVLFQTSHDLDMSQKQFHDLQGKFRSLSQEHETLKREFDFVVEKLRHKTIESEENISRYQRSLLNKQEAQAQLERLLRELEAVNKLVEIKDQELMASKTQFITKTEELSGGLQQLYHMESALKQVKDEKLKYAHELQQKEKFITELQEQLNQMQQFKIKHDQMICDIDVIRRNYTDLLEQKKQEKEHLQSQIDVLRQMNEYTHQDLEQKYNDLMHQQLKQYQEDIQKNIKLQTVQSDSEIETLRNKLQTMAYQMQQQDMQLNSYKQNIQFQNAQEIYQKEAQFRELRNQYENLMVSFDRVNQNLQEWETRLNNGEIIIYDQTIKQQLQQSVDLLKIKQDLEHENQVLRNEVHLLKDNNQLLQQQLSALSHQVNQQSQMLMNYTPNQSNILKPELFPKQQLGKSSDQDKLRFLIRVVEELKSEIKQKDAKLSSMRNTGLPQSQVSYRQPVTKNSFYHITEEDSIK
ncbi:hypothetical protein pb186bvf_005908 [Paramecium bursaria]